MASPCIGFEIGLGHICWYFRAYICSKILKVLHPCIGFGIGLGHIWGHANAWIWYIHAYAWILYIHVLSHISHIPKAEIFGFMFQYLSSERMGLRFWANPIHNTWLDHGEISRTRCTPFCPVMKKKWFGGTRNCSKKVLRGKKCPCPLMKFSVLSGGMGWRGYALSRRIQRLGFLKTSRISNIVKASNCSRSKALW